MATAVKVRQQDVGDGEIIDADVTPGSTYAHSVGGIGELITAAMLGFRCGIRLDSVSATPVGGRRVEFIPDASLPDRGKLKIMDEHLGEDFMLNRPLLAIGTSSAAAVKITNPITSVVSGAILELAAAEHAFTATTHDITADADLIQEAIYLLSDDGAGGVTVTKGTTDDEDASVPPALPATDAVLGYVKIKVAAGAVDFDATSDDLDDSHLTTTFFDADGEVLQGTDLSDITFRVVAHGR